MKVVHANIVWANISREGKEKEETLCGGMEFLDWTFPPSDTPNDTPGVRLGVSYLRTLKDSISISIRLDDSSTLDLEISQVSMGPMAISSVVWDAGLYLVDFLESNAHIDLVDRIELGKTLELGTGTGICGITEQSIYPNLD